jgi:hypothetical protein
MFAVLLQEFFSSLIAMLPAAVAPRSQVWTCDGKGCIDFLIEFDEPDATIGTKYHKWGIELLFDALNRMVRYQTSQLQRIH